MPDIGVHLAADVLELIQVPDGNAAVDDGDALDFTKSVWVEKAQLLGAVAENESLSISSQTPALARIPECSTRREAREVVDERNIGPPRELHELAVPFRQPFSKVRPVKVMLLYDLAGFEPDLSQG